MSDNKMAIDLAVSKNSFEWFMREVANDKESLRKEFQQELDKERKRIEKLETKIDYYNRVAVKWGGILCLVVAVGSLLAAASEKTRDVILSIVHLYKG